jgi:hypothetical protein
MGVPSLDRCSFHPLRRRFSVWQPAAAKKATSNGRCLERLRPRFPLSVFFASHYPNFSNPHLWFGSFPPRCYSFVCLVLAHNAIGLPFFSSATGFQNCARLVPPSLSCDSVPELQSTGRTTAAQARQPRSPRTCVSCHVGRTNPYQ